jgi:2-C-methyl-D-erythritol 4-phosphate cytidylyltransferase
VTESSLTAALLLTAAGSSSRFLSSATAFPDTALYKKEYLDLDGLPVLYHAMRPFLLLPEIVRLVVTVPKGDEEKVRTLLASVPGFAPLLGERELLIAAGGSSRQASILAGLSALEKCGRPADIVLVHDGARPWVSGTVIRRVLEACRVHGAVIPVLPSTSAMKEIGPDGIITRHLPRVSTFEAQTPQGFRFGEIVRAHRQVAGDGRVYIDDAEVYASAEGAVAAVPGDPLNRKITYRSDLL